MTPTATANLDKLDQLHRRLSAEVLGLISGSDWQAMLGVASRLHRYSARNIFLIHAQRPDATRVAGFHRWRSLGRHVRRGESGIAILAPCVYRAKAVNEADDAGDVPAASALRGFKIAYVFDESQTDGPPLPDVRPRLLVGEDTARLWSGLAAQVAAAGYRIQRGYCRGANGVTDFVARTVRVRDDVDELQSTKTLCHELAHVLLHGPEGDAVASNVAEVEAESVAYVVCQAAGMATTDYSLPYLARWSRGDVGLIMATADRVLITARTILRTLGVDTEEVEAPGH
jgi:antirestriction protein ArdC